MLTDIIVGADMLALTSDEIAIGNLMAIIAGMSVLVLGIAVAVQVFVISIGTFLASKLFGYQDGFGTAVKCAVVVVVINIVFTFGSAFIPLDGFLLLILSLAAIIYPYMAVYDCGIFVGFFMAVFSAILSVISIFAVAFLAIGAAASAAVLI